MFLPPLCARETLARVQNGGSSTELSADCARLKNGSRHGFGILMENSRASVFVWEAAMCQHAALSIKVTLCVCVCDFLASVLFKALKPKSKLWGNTLQRKSVFLCFHSGSLEMSKCLLKRETKGKPTLNISPTTER